MNNINGVNQTHPSSTENPKQVLIVEDDPACQLILERVIHSLHPDAKIDFFGSAELASRALNEKSARSGPHYDLIIADIFLEGQKSGLDFWEACQHRFPRTPFAITSSMPLDQFFSSIGNRAISPPFLAKPLRIGESRQIIGGLFNYGDHR